MSLAYLFGYCIVRIPASDPFPEVGRAAAEFRAQTALSNACLKWMLLAVQIQLKPVDGADLSQEEIIVRKRNGRHQHTQRLEMPSPEEHLLGQEDQNDRGH